MLDTIPKFDAETFVINTLYEVNGVLPEKIQLKDTLMHDLLMDSIEMVDLFMRLEDIEVVIPESEITEDLSVGDLIRIVASAK